MSDLSNNANEQQAQILRYLTPAKNDPSYLVLKAHLIAEEELNRFLGSRAKREAAIYSARLSFAQLLALCRAFHPFAEENWWVWNALQKLNSLRNTLAHNLEPKDLQERIIEFSVFVADSAKMTKSSELAGHYDELIADSVHPFILAVVALLGYLSGALSVYRPKQ